MQRALAHALLLAGLALAAQGHAQLGVPSPAVQAESHIFSAFTTRSDPRVLADDLKLGSALKGQLGADLSTAQLYDALMARIAGWQLRTSSVPPGEAASYTALGVNSADPLVIVEAGDVRLLMQYSVAEKSVAFVEQLAGAPVAAPTLPPDAKPHAQAPKPEAIVEKALPTEPPPAVTVAPAAAAKPKPVPVAVPKPTIIPKVAPVVAAPKAAAPAKPRGECVIKPVMTEDDLWNCSAPGQVSNPLVSTPAPAVSAASSSAFAPTPVTPQRECVIKPVMTEDDLRACGSTR
jgi:hypothetical protein